MKKYICIILVLVVAGVLGVYNAQADSHEEITIELVDQYLFVNGMQVENVTINFNNELYHLYVNEERHMRVTTGDGNIVWRQH
jgi:hypothetical protein